MAKSPSSRGTEATQKAPVLGSGGIEGDRSHTFPSCVC